jgi:steroid 5-alpha reductase family enzyme
MMIVSALCLIFSFINDNYSQVDRIWSIIPCIYTWIFALYPSIKLGENLNTRLLIASILVTLWSFRLTFNFYRKGGYTAGGEDYRWPYLRKNIISNPILFQIFNLLFISFYQNFLLLSLILPAYIMFVNRNNSFGNFDVIIAISFLTFFLGEIISDQQQWNFQNKKKELKELNKLEGEFAVGFITSGLFRYSRHPNFFCEIMIWYCFYSFSAASCSELFNITITGPTLLALLFQGSTWLTEKISCEKYPKYSEYQKIVNRLLPWFSGKVKLD